MCSVFSLLCYVALLQSPWTTGLLSCHNNFIFYNCVRFSRGFEFTSYNPLQWLWMIFHWWWNILWFYFLASRLPLMVEHFYFSLGQERKFSFLNFPKFRKGISSGLVLQYQSSICQFVKNNGAYMFSWCENYDSFIY